ncbi:hypothetical protein PROFUN_04723 [Planoprotostelium fungivorum]|uniref:Uncharacterized protein n=1 Tax=Planoprotostelium fungivorum TaxID=1890364 RepID=A0A2P6NFX3_9EUKA|nr:hypothetical protein PROFUN_04723 [Planoprotostelium fungivorum]
MTIQRVAPSDSDNNMHTMEVQGRGGPGAEEAIETIQRSLPSRVYMAIVWLTAFALMSWYTSSLAGQLFDSRAKPGTVITYENSKSLPYPGVAVCSYTVYSERPEQLSDANRTFILEVIDTAIGGEWTPIFIWANESATSNECYIWNFGPENKTIWSTHTGIYGAITVDFSFYERPGVMGVTIGFYDSTTDPLTLGDEIYNSITIVGVQQQNFFQIQYVNEVHSEENFSGKRCSVDDSCQTIPQNSTYFDWKYTSAPLDTFVDNPAGSKYNGSILFSYQKLSKQTIEYQTQYKLQNFFGDFAGMLGTLMGIDGVKIFSGLIVLILGAKFRTLSPIEDHWN